jgi:DNA-binding LytR/AlgR family response regulator
MDCIIIDDDKVSRLLLEKYVSKTDFLNLLASFDSAVEAINSMYQFKNIDLIFLDIEMPEMTGIEFIKSLEILPQVVIVSAREKYAIEAIEYDVIDYLLKPISYARFYKAVTKAKKKSDDEKKINKSNGVFIKETGGNFTRIKYEDILWVEALENYIAIYSLQDKYTIHFTMKSIEHQLPEEIFYRVHRSFLVNINKIEAIEDNSVVVKYQNERKYIPIAKNSKDELLKKINVITK